MFMIIKDVWINSRVYNRIFVVSEKLVLEIRESLLV